MNWRFTIIQRWAGAILAAMVTIAATSSFAASSCTSARSHDWRDTGCPPNNYPGAGGPSAPKSCAGHNCGMPGWSVSEPYINLHISDTPLSYKMSSGKDMDFTIFYRTRAQMPLPDESPAIIPASPYEYKQFYPRGPSCGTNAFWSLNWNKSIMIQDVGTETPSFSGGYTALVFRSDGGIDNYSNGAAVFNKDPGSQVTLQDVSGAGYPSVEQYSSGILVNLPVADGNGIFWGDPNIGVKLVNPDGSQDVFGLSCYPAAGARQQIRMFLTQRISPQGRTTSLGYEYVTFTNWWTDLANGLAYGSHSMNGYRLRFIIDEDGRTNSIVYNNNAPANSYSISHACIEDTTTFIPANAPPRGPLQITEIDDPYGRKTTFGYDLVSGILTNVVDAAGLMTKFQYMAPAVTESDLLPDPSNLCHGGGACPVSIVGMGTSGGWITNMTTPYGTTGFYYYETNDPTGTNSVMKRAIYVTEPEGARQLYTYIQKAADVNGNPLIAQTATAPSVPGQTLFDDGFSGPSHCTFEYRNTIHWGPLQFPNLSSAVQTSLPFNISNALAVLTTNDFNRGRIRHWMLQGDLYSFSDAISSEREPCQDTAGKTEGPRTWYNYGGKTDANVMGSNPQITCVANLLPDGSPQYTVYNYYSTTGVLLPAGTGLVSDNESTYTKTDGSIGILTNWFTYAANNIDLLSTSNSAGQFVHYGYDNGHRYLAITNALGQITTFSWDSFANLQEIQYPSGESVTFNRNYTSLPDSNYLFPGSIVFSPSGRSFTNTYFAGLPVTVTDERGLTVTNTWDGLNRLTSTIYPDSTYTSNRYDRLDLGGVRDRLNNWTSFVHDGLQHLTWVTNANGVFSSNSWCGCGALESVTDASNNTTAFGCNNMGYLTSVSFPDGSSTTYQYDWLGRMTNVVDGSLRSVGIQYNNQGLPTNYVGAYGSLQSTIYDAVNRPISVTDANGITISNQFDLINELTNRLWSDGVGEAFVYAANGLIAYTNRDGQPTFYLRDLAGRVLAVTNANHEVTHFAYDSLGNITTLIDGNGNTTQWQYNEFGWVTNKINALGSNVLAYAYNQNGWATNRWTPEKGNAGYSYDGVGNLTNITYSPQLQISYQYDLLNRLQTMVDVVGTTKFGYDAASRLTNEISPWPTAAVGYSYTQGSRAALNITEPNSIRGQTYQYDAIWRLTNVTSSAAGQFGYSYNVKPSSSLLSATALPNSGSITNSYDVFGRLNATKLLKPDNSILDSESYFYDPASYRTQQVFTAGNFINYSYDNIGQVTTANGYESNSVMRLHEQLGYAYDKGGGLLSRANNGLIETFTNNSLNQLSNVGWSGSITLAGVVPNQVTNVEVWWQPPRSLGLPQRSSTAIYGDGTFASKSQLPFGSGTYSYFEEVTVGGQVSDAPLATYVPGRSPSTYDNNGNLISDGSGNSYSYDLENELTNVVSLGQQSSFFYDGLGRCRIEQDFAWQNGAWVKSNEIHFIYDGNLLIQERDGLDHERVKVTYTRGLDMSGGIQTAGGIGGLLARTDSSGSTYYHSDANGNVMALVNGSQNVVARYLYAPFGQIEGKWGALADANTMQFSSMPHHNLSGLSLYPSRAYEPNLQRWLNQDPIQEAGGLNLYRAMDNNPLSFIDPLGLDDDDDDLDKRLGILQNGGSAMFADLAYDKATKERHDQIMCEGIQAILNGAKDIAKEAAEQVVMAVVTDGIGNLLTAAKIAKGAEATAIADGCRIGCFVQGTEVATENGQKAIEDVRAGDRIWAWNEKTGEVALKPVTATLNHDDSELVRVELGDASIDATTEHPFWVEDFGWIGAAELQVGDEVGTLDGVKQVTKVERYAKHVRVFNLVVADFHTYFVSAAQVLVHNTGNCPAAAKGGIGPVLQGQAGVARAISEYEAAGGTVLGTEISLRSGGGLTRPDFYGESAQGIREFIEVKNGAGAGLNPNQARLFPIVEQSGAVPVGANAARAGLTPGVPIPPTPVKVIKYP